MSGYIDRKFIIYDINWRLLKTKELN